MKFKPMQDRILIQVIEPEKPVVYAPEQLAERPVFGIVMVLGLRAVAVIGQGWNSGAKRWQDVLPERSSVADAVRTGSQPSRTEQLVARASAPEYSFAEVAAGLVHTSQAGATRRSGEVADALALSTSHSGPKLGQVYHRSQHKSGHRGDAT